MEVLNKYMPLAEGETVLESIQGNAYTLSANPLLRFLAVIERIVAVLTGSPRKVHIFVTPTRVISIETRKFLWVFDGSVSARSYTPRSIKQIGYTLQRSLFVFISHYLEFESGSTAYLVKSKQGKPKVDAVIKEIVELSERVTRK